MNIGTLDFPPGRGVGDSQGTQSYGGLVTGENRHVVNLPAVISCLVPGLVFRYTPLDANTGLVGIVVNGFGPFALLKPGLQALVAGDIQPGHSLQVLYRAPGVFEILSGIEAAPPVLPDFGTAATKDAGTGPGQVLLIPGSGQIPLGLIDPQPAYSSLNNLSESGYRKTARAWGSFNGSGAPQGIHPGVDSVARTGIGRYTVTLAPALDHNDYAVMLTCDGAATSSARVGFVESGSRAADSFKVVTVAGNDIADLDRVSFTVFA